MSDMDLEPLDVPAPWRNDPIADLNGSPPPRRPYTGALVGLLVLMLIAGITAYAVTSRLRSDTPFDTATANPSSPGATIPAIPSGPARGTPVLGTDPDASVLRRLGVQQQDVGAGASVQLIPDGDRVGSTTTLDLCNGSYPSEALRRARFQVIESDSSNNPALSTEAVLYRNPDAAAQALTELRNVRAHCPNSPVPSPVGEQTATTTFSAPPDKGWPETKTVERLAYKFDTVDLQGDATHSIAVYLRRGRVFLGVYFPNPDGAQPAVAGHTTIASITQVLAERIAALPAAVVDRHT